MGTLQVNRECFSCGHYTHSAAAEALADYYAQGVISKSETPKIKAYRNRRGVKRYSITIRK